MIVCVYLVTLSRCYGDKGVYDFSKCGIPLIRAFLDDGQFDLVIKRNVDYVAYSCVSARM